MANDLNTNLPAIRKDNIVLKLKKFLKHDHFACKSTQFDF
jgi:hypothetical protein